MHYVLHKYRSSFSISSSWFDFKKNGGTRPWTAVEKKTKSARDSQVALNKKKKQKKTTIWRRRCGRDSGAAAARRRCRGRRRRRWSRPSRRWAAGAGWSGSRVLGSRNCGPRSVFVFVFFVVFATFRCASQGIVPSSSIAPSFYRVKRNWPSWIELSKHYRFLTRL